jgi:hypothetical protein
MIQAKTAFFVAAALAIALTVQAANAAPLTSATTALASGSNLMLQTHGCHWTCFYGATPGAPRHRHRVNRNLAYCESAVTKCFVNWGRLFGLREEPSSIKQRRSH